MGSQNNISGPLVLGERLKQKFLDTNVASTLLDLFFDFPWNNFLHSIVYDLIHQVLTGRVDGGYNRELTIGLFRDARLLHRIIEGSKRNDIESAKPKGVRLGYMGHLTLISEDVINALEHFPPELRLIIAQHAPQPEWDEYVTGRYKETKKKDSSLLGGGKPVIAPGMRGAAQWKVDEADTGTATNAERDREAEQEGRGELRRNVRTAREGSADFGAAPMEEDDDDEFHAGPPHFARYLAQEMQGSSEHFSSDEASDDDEDGGWLAHSSFELRPPPTISTRQHNGPQRSPSRSGFDDSFAPASSSTEPTYSDPFDDDTFGPFTDAAAAPSTSTTDPFGLSSSGGATEEMIEESSFDNFGDFGDFQSAGTVESVGTLSPTPGSWSFDSVSSTSSLDEHLGPGRVSESPKEHERTGRDA